MGGGWEGHPHERRVRGLCRESGSSRSPRVSGMNTTALALGMQAEVLLDKNIEKLRAADRIYQGHLRTVASNAYEIERACLDADLVIGAVLVPGAKASSPRPGGGACSQARYL